ncbi:MAG TPA: FtsW/RodA/SpoVE family cell cycle protein [Candidatus Acidoferrales bacterium]|nr:FtsW/RodA/SpoVE family cell cycle protein [Candidatus Acidoferrales bacterium]
MAVTRSRTQDRAEVRFAAARPAWRTRELLLTLLAALLVAAGLFQVHRAKAGGLPEVDHALAAKRLLNLNELNTREELLPALTPYFPRLREREEAARGIYYLSGGLSNVGAIARHKLLSADQFRLLKPLFVVRRPAQFERAFYLWSALFFAVFLLAHFWWSVRGFRGEQTFLPALLLLSGAGLIEMISLRDPVRDNLLFVDFAQGVVAGVVLMVILSALDFERLAGRLSYVPLVASFVLSVLLVLFGSGPGTSDARVNLFGFQPVEIIRLLLVFFLAGYFAQRWDILRHARETRESLAPLTRRFDIPPVEYTLPVLVCVALCLVFFFAQKDMGPALVFACLFLVLYGIARGGVLVPFAGLALLLAGFTAGSLLGVPHTVGERVSMWRSPWDNTVHGGDQLAHSLWAYATGGVWGAGIGEGEPNLVPAGHTDLILAALGEEGGFLLVALVFALVAYVVWRAFRIALRARTDYEFFLAAGLAAVTALQFLLIAGGSLGVLPLSGVVTPFLSFGRTAMIANFAVFAILLSISGHPADSERAAPFRVPVFAAGLIFAVLGAVTLAKAAYVQVFRSGPTVGEGTLVVQADGARRYQYNPRLQEIMREIPKGTIFDRNGLPLATSDWAELEKHRAGYRALGIDIDAACRRTDSRHYPFGGLTFDLLGDLRTRTRWGASNTSFVERDSARRLRGYDDRPTLLEIKNPRTGQMERVLRYDYRELVPLLRYRHEPNRPEVRRVLDRPRDVRMSIDARLQVQVAAILGRQLQQAHVDKGAAVVLDPATGDLLAAVSLPLPQEGDQQPEGNPYLDRARYGLYPPGSTFKVVTAMAALRKNPELTHKTYQCVPLADGRVGNYIQGSKRPIRDDIMDKTPHGTLDLEHALIVSCNAYFAQLGAYDVGADALHDTAATLGIAAASPDTAAELKKSLPQSSYGQGEVVASPFQMARVAATVANGGAMPQGRWIVDETNARTTAPAAVLRPEMAATLGKFMREVVTSGTGRRASGAFVSLAGKTGTAELANAPSHAWFIGFAPNAGNGRKVALSVLVENGVYGGTAAAPAAAEIVNAAAKLGLIQP